RPRERAIQSERSERSSPRETPPREQAPLALSESPQNPAIASGALADESRSAWFRTLSSAVLGLPISYRALPKLRSSNRQSSGRTGRDYAGPFRASRGLRRLGRPRSTAR